MRYGIAGIGCFLVGLLMAGTPRPAVAEITDLKIAKQYGISYLPLMLMEADKLVEGVARADGLGDLTTTWSTFTSGAVMNDAILSGNLHIASGGVGPLLQFWAATKGGLDVKCVAAMNTMPLYLNTRNSAVQTIKDLGPADRIALPAVKVSIQAVTLQMAAEAAFGAGQANKLDALTVSMSHPEGQAALLSGASEVTAHFTAPPFQEAELKQSGVRRILNSYEVLGGPATFNLVWATSKFRTENPKAYAVFVKAFAQATRDINADKKRAAERYLEIAKDKRSSVADILAILENPEIEFTMTPRSLMKYGEFMARVGNIKQRPQAWTDLCHDNVHGLPGS